MLWYMQLSLEANIGHSKQTIKFAKSYGVWAENMKDYKIWLEERMKKASSKHFRIAHCHYEDEKGRGEGERSDRQVIGEVESHKRQKYEWK